MLEVRSLLRGRSISVDEVLCRAVNPAPSGEEVEPGFSIVFPRAGVFVRHVGSDRVVANPATALFLNQGDVQRTSHPRGLGDESIVISLAPGFADPFLDPRTEQFPLQTMVTTAGTDLVIRRLARDAAAGAATPLDAEEAVLVVLDGSLVASSRRPRITAHQRSVVADAQEYLSSCFAEDADLPTIANAVGSSPHHLSRLFRSKTGSTMSAYRTQLRMRAAIRRLSEGDRDLATVAVESGFYDHAHMTNTIRYHTGTTPTEIRKILGSAAGADTSS